MAENANIVRMMCPNLKCRTLLCVPHAARGKTVRCRSCGAVIKVPMPKPDPVPQQPDDANAA